MQKVNVQTKEKAVKDYLDSNVSLAVVAKRYGVSVESIRRWVIGAGYKTRSTRTRYPNEGLKEETKVSKKVPFNERNFIKFPYEKRVNNRWTWREDSTLKGALFSGFTVKEVSELLGRSINSIYRRKTNLTRQGFIEKGIRFKLPKRTLQEKSISAQVGPEISEMNCLNKKCTKINEVEKKNETSKSIVGGIEKIGVKEVKEIQRVTKDKKTHLNVISLEDLVEIVKKHNISVSISILKAGTEIRITK